MVASPAAVSRLPVGGRFVVLDTLRGMAALMVSAYHMPVLAPAFAIVLVRQSWLFVEFFFVLSGFVTAGAYSRRIVPTI